MKKLLLNIFVGMHTSDKVLTKKTKNLIIESNNHIQIQDPV
jgi:hypothetical protein